MDQYTELNFQYCPKTWQVSTQNFLSKYAPNLLCCIWLLLNASFVCSVTACLEALKYILPGALVIQAQLACYAVAQVPHLQDSEQEWKWFTKCVLELMGFQTEDKFKVINCHIVGASIRHWG